MEKQLKGDQVARNLPLAQGRHPQCVRGGQTCLSVPRMNGELESERRSTAACLSSFTVQASGDRMNDQTRPPCDKHKPATFPPRDVGVPQEVG
eukprot:scaffold56791_cov56-Phaeocystis_antarctica.AAC.5